MLRAFQRASDALMTMDERAGNGAAGRRGAPSSPSPVTGDERGRNQGRTPGLVVSEPLRQRRDGGWRSGARTIRGDWSGGVIVAGICPRGEAWMDIEGAPVSPFSVTFAPWGFRMTVGDLIEGVSYAVGLRPPEGPPRISILPYGPGLLQFGTRIRVLCTAVDPDA